MTGLRWSRRTTTRISEELCQLGIAVCPNTVARLLHQMGYSLRVNHKQISTDSSPDRNLQFERRRHSLGHLRHHRESRRLRRGCFPRHCRLCSPRHRPLVAATAIAATPGRRSCNPNWPTLSTWWLPSPIIRPALPNGIRSNIGSSPRSRETGLANPWTPTRRFSIMPEPPRLKPALPLPPTWIAANIQAA